MNIHPETTIMIEFSIEDDALRCKINQEIVASKIPEMRNLLASYLDSHQDWKELVFDCRDVKTLDSIGVNFIVGAYKKAYSSNREFRIIGCNNSVYKVLSLFKLNEKFEILPSTAS